MKAKIEQVNRYKITIGNQTWDDFEKVSEWNGMIEFSNKVGVVIVAEDNGDFFSVFAEIFKPQDIGGPSDLIVVKVSTCLLDP